MSQAATERHESYLTQLTSLPTASGREHRVIDWITAWSAKRPNTVIRHDRFGNLMLSRRGAAARKPIIFTAHLDHPAFVVTGVEGRRVLAEFRGGVHADFFPGAGVRLFHADRRPQRGVVRDFTPLDQAHPFHRVAAVFPRDVHARVGDVMTWDLPPARIRGGRLWAPACDDLAAVAAALAAFETVHRSARPGPDVRVLLTRAEEVGFIGALAACRSRLIPKQARLIPLEVSKSFPESPIGAGPIIRVGDRISIFNHALTYQLVQLAQSLDADRPDFRWQRKLMPGGACEATAFQEFGFSAACICLPLGNYHNMDEDAGRIAAETIALTDYHNLIQLLAAIARRLDQSGKPDALRTRLDRLFEQRVHLLDGSVPPSA